MIIDANGRLLGRLGTKAAKAALRGEEVVVVNCKKAMVSGDKNKVMDRFINYRSRGTPVKGPFIRRRPDMIVKKSIRGMLPHKKTKGREAIDRIKCYNDVPEDMKDKKMEQTEGVEKLPLGKYVSIEEICRRMGA